MSAISTRQGARAGMGHCGRCWAWLQDDTAWEYHIGARAKRGRQIQNEDDSAATPVCTLFNSRWVPGPQPVGVRGDMGGSAESLHDEVMEDLGSEGGFDMEQIQALLEGEYGGDFPCRDATKPLKFQSAEQDGGFTGIITPAERAVGLALPYLPQKLQDDLVASLQGA